MVEVECVNQYMNTLGLRRALTMVMILWRSLIPRFHCSGGPKKQNFCLCDYIMSLHTRGVETTWAIQPHLLIRFIGTLGLTFKMRKHGGTIADQDVLTWCCNHHCRDWWNNDHTPPISWWFHPQAWISHEAVLWCWSCPCGRQGQCNDRKEIHFV